MATLNSLENSIMTINKALLGLGERMNSLEDGQAIYVSKADLQTVTGALSDQITAMNVALSKVEQKLTKIILPEDTRYYLVSSEITDFRTNFRQLRGMMVELEKTRQAFIKLAARYNLTNSSM